MKRIVVGSDGSDTAREAVRQAAELAAATGATLEIVHAYHESTPRDPATAYDPTVREDAAMAQLPADVPRPVGRRAEAGEGLDAEIAAATKAGVTEIVPSIVPGDPADVLISVAERTGADLIVVGNKGMTGAARFLLGSVPNKITHHAPCNVLVVRTV